MPPGDCGRAASILRLVEVGVHDPGRDISQVELIDNANLDQLHEPPADGVQESLVFALVTGQVEEQGLAAGWVAEEDVPKGPHTLLRCYASVDGLAGVPVHDLVGLRCSPLARRLVVHIPMLCAPVTGAAEHGIGGTFGRGQIGNL